MILPCHNGSLHYAPGKINGWAPRFGFAYRVTDDNKTALRGGYGIFINQESGNPQVNMSLSNPPFQFNTAIATDPAIPDVRYETAFGSTARHTS